jgi:valyl-tRNA synthetase
MFLTHGFLHRYGHSQLLAGPKKQRVKTFYPTSVLITGFDIIFFWVARMIMMGKKFVGEVPFKEIYVHGLSKTPLEIKCQNLKGI